MATVERPDAVSVSDDRLVVRDLAVSDPEVVSYFGSLPESEQLDRRLEQALRIGVLAITSTNASQNVNFVETAFEAMKSELGRKMDDVFDEKGPLSDVIARHFGEDGTVIREQFNPDREGSPLYELRAYLDRTLVEIRDKLGEQEAARQVAGKGTQKGRDFEAWCEEGLSLAAKANADTLESTGAVSGSVGGSKKGDFVATLSGAANTRIVFEMKDKISLSVPGIRRELEAAMSNRDALYGVLVAKSRASLPDTTGWFNEYGDGTMLACAVEDSEGNAVLGGEMLVMAYRWARARAAAEARARAASADSTGDTVDAELVGQKARKIGERLAGLAKIRRECTNVEKTSGKIRDLAGELETGIKADVDEIAALLEVSAR